MPLAGRLVRRLAPCAALLAAVALLAACSSAPAPEAPSRARLAGELRAYLPDPAPLAGGAGSPEIGALHRRLLDGDDPARLRTEVEALEPAAERGAASRLLLAEIALVEGDARRAADEAVALGGSAEAALVAGRASELAHDPVAAVTAYRAAEARFPIAGERRAKLEPEAVVELRRRIEEALAARQVEAARAELVTLSAWRPAEAETLRLAARVARAAGDRRSELEARRALVAAAEEEAPADRLRRGVLEVEVGDAGGGLELLESLAAAHPEDAEIRREWLRARLHFRLANAPEGVRRAAAAPAMSRAEFALVLYWLVPEVRASRGGTPRIATDILDHPAREEIVRVANLDLLRVDEDLHLFEPERPLRRWEAFRALAMIADGVLAGATGGGGDPATVCARAAVAGWIGEAGECLPSAPVAGREAIDWIRALAGLEGGGAP